MSGKIKWKLLEARVRGAGHIKNNMPCQDAIKWLNLGEEGIVCAVADGHGSSKCPYSDEGADIAVTLGLNLFETLILQNDEVFFYKLLEMIKTVQFPKTFEKEWKEEVFLRHQDQKREMPERLQDVYTLYGTTLMVLWIHQDFIFALQIGDGDLLVVDDKGETSWLIENEVQYGTETYSLCQKESWKYFKSRLYPLKEVKHMPKLFLICTDGYRNSFINDKAFLQIGKDYLELINSYETSVLEEALPQWLEEASAAGSGDDITLALIVGEEA